MRWLVVILMLTLAAHGEEAEKQRLARLLEKIQGAEGAGSTEAWTELGELARKDLPLFLAVLREGRLLERPEGVRFRIATDQTSEAMSGSWSADGESTTYRLKSKGDGTYELNATVRGTDGNERTVRDEGSLASLRRKYPFLRQAGMIFLSDVPFASATAPRRDRSAARVAELGVKVRAPSDDLRHHLALPEGAGLLLDQVEAGSVAEKLGLRPFDVIVRIGGELVEKAEQLKDLANKRRPDFEYYRRAQLHHER